MLSFTLITTANTLCAELHDLMPVILKPERWSVRLGELPVDMPQLKALLAPCPDEMRVGKPEDIAEAYRYLMKTGFSTGEAIVVDDGAPQAP